MDDQAGVISSAEGTLSEIILLMQRDTRLIGGKIYEPCPHVKEKASMLAACGSGKIDE